MIKVSFKPEMTEWASVMIINLGEAGYEAFAVSIDDDRPESFSLSSSVDLSSEKRDEVMGLLRKTFDELEMDYRVLN